MNAAASVMPQSRTTGAVLIVDDEILIRLDLAEQLRVAGFEVIEASSGEEALTVLRNIDSVALVITDVRMPGKMDGQALTSWLRREMPAVKVIMVSGHLSASHTSAADAAFQKPVDVAVLIEKAGQLLGGTSL